jgi:two-component system, NtrC family, sensor kinase
MNDRVILVVDDEPSVVQLCKRLLEKASFDVIPVTSPSQALAILARQPVDLLLADIRMPGLDGFQLLQLARNHQPDLAAVIMTGFGTVEMAISALRRGADGLILKPFDNLELVQTVENVLVESEHKREMARVRSLRPLFRITETLFSETDYENLKDLIVNVIVDHMNCTIAGLFQKDTKYGSYIIHAWKGSELKLDSQTQKQILLNRVIQEQAPLTLTHDGFDSNEAGTLLEDNGLGSLLCVPFFMSEEAWVLVLGRSINQELFSEADQEMFRILTRQAGLALENARLYAELRSYVNKLESAQHALSQAEKMASAGRLTASIAHEINNPLQSLHNCLHLAGRKELPQKEREKNLQLAQSELERLMVIVRRMLDFYRPGIRDRKLVDINELLKRILELLSPQLKESAITVHYDLMPGLPPVMAVDDQIKQVLINLILNAMEAMPSGGEIFITTSAGSDEYIADDTLQTGVEIIIRDTGPGIRETEKEKIFEPFVSTKEHGTGLGLTVSYGIITAHGGRLDLVNCSPQGACFRIVLPYGEE